MPTLSLTAVLWIVWGATMTALYVQERNHSSPPPIVADTTLRSGGKLGIAAISHINVVVNDSIDVGATYY